ncbi:MAG: DUF5522 domain-containing protein [Ferrimicrobium sp.]
MDRNVPSKDSPGHNSSSVACQRISSAADCFPDRVLFPSDRRLDYSDPATLARLERHLDALEGGRDSYLDPVSDQIVLTSATLMARGLCCSLGCRHCPYTGGLRPDPILWESSPEEHRLLHVWRPRE